MTDAAQIVENLIDAEGIHAFVFICEAADKYLPIVSSLAVTLENGTTVPVWALRFFKKALAEELLWMCRNEPDFFKKRFNSAPAANQPILDKQLRKLSDVDLTPFQENDPNDPESIEAPFLGFPTIDAINSRLGHYIRVAETYGKDDPADPIHTLRLDRQTFGEVISAYRRSEVYLRRKQFPGAIEMIPTPEGPFDMRDKEGPVETVVNFPDGWKWVDLHRSYSPMRDDRTAPSDIAITGHCANCAGKSGDTAFELLEPIGKNKWKHHAFFLLHPDGRLGEMKGRKNQKPSPRLEKYIFELLRRVKKIKGIGGHSSWNSQHDFALGDLTKPHLEILKKERPELVSSYRPND
jgi:hypothetical protein